MTHTLIGRLRGAAVAAALLIGTSAFAQAGGPDEGPGRAPAGPHAPDGPGPRGFARGGPAGLPFLRGLDLSPAQQDRVFAILHEGAPQRRELDKAWRKARREVRALAGAATFDQARAAAGTRALGQALADREMLRLQTTARLMAVLTPEQRERLDARRKGAQHGHGRDRGPAAGGGRAGGQRGDA